MATSHSDTTSELLYVVEQLQEARAMLAEAYLLLSGEAHPDVADLSRQNFLARCEDDDLLMDMVHPKGAA